MISSRRSFIAGLGAALFTAPAIVRASSLMPVKRIILPAEFDLNEMVALLNLRLDDDTIDGYRRMKEIEARVGLPETPYMRATPKMAWDDRKFRWTLA